MNEWINVCEWINELVSEHINEIETNRNNDQTNKGTNKYQREIIYIN